MPGAICTIIIPTHERHDILLRAIDYYQHFDCNVSIADSSDSKFNHKLPDNIIYKHLPKARLTEKIYEAVKDIKTPYACLVGDDDYLLESSLKAAACFLDDNEDYVSAQGKYYKFKLIKNQVTFSPRSDLSSTYYAVESEDRFFRFVRAFNPYRHQIYSLHRTDLLIKTWKFASASSTPDSQSTVLFTLELVQPLVPMFHGKHKVLPILWMIRDMYIFDFSRRKKQLTDAPMINHSVYYNYNRFSAAIQKTKAFILSEECRVLKQSFRDITADLSSNKESDLLFNAAFKSYIKWLASERNKIIIKIVLKLFIPNWILKHYKARKEKKYSVGIEDTVYKNDFDKIRLSILNFQKCYDNL